MRCHEQIVVCALLLPQKLLKMEKTNKILEGYLNANNSNDLGKNVAAQSIKSLLGQLDFSAEVVPENNHEMLSRLISSLKKDDLTIQEKRIIEEIIKFRFE